MNYSTQVTCIKCGTKMKLKDMRQGYLCEPKFVTATDGKSCYVGGCFGK